MDDSQIQYLTESVNRVKDAKIKKIDGNTVFLAIQLLLNDGCKRGEFVRLRLKDIVFDQGAVVGINIEGYGHLDLEIDSRKLLDQHLRNLFGNNNIDKNAEAPVFPEYYGSSGEKKMNRHLKILNEQLGIHIDLHYIKKIGVLRHYQKCMKMGMSREGAIEATKGKFRYRSGNQVINIINSFVVEKPAKKPKSTKPEILFLELDKLPVFDFTNKDKTRKYAINCLNRIGSLQISATEKRDLKIKFIRELQETLKTKSALIHHLNPSRQKGLYEIITGETPDKYRPGKISQKLDFPQTETTSVNNESKVLPACFKCNIDDLIFNCEMVSLREFAFKTLRLLIKDFDINGRNMEMVDPFFPVNETNFIFRIGGKLFDISLNNPVGLFPNYDALVEYLLHEIGQYSLKVGRKDKREVHLMEQDVLLSAIAISWSNFDEKERKEFYHGLCDRHNKDLLSFRMPVESIRKGKSFRFDAFDKIYETGSTAFLKIAGLLVKVTHSKLYDKDISLISDPAYEFWAGIFINKIMDRLNRLPYGNSIVLALGCVAAAAFARQVEFFKSEGISFDQIKAYEITPESWTADDKSLYRTQFIDGKSK